MTRSVCDLRLIWCCSIFAPLISSCLSSLSSIDRSLTSISCLSCYIHTGVVISYSTTYLNPYLILSALIIFLVRNLNIPLKRIFLVLLLDFFALLTKFTETFIEPFLLFFELLLPLLQKVLSVDCSYSQLLLLFQLLRLDIVLFFFFCLVNLLLL